jgi:hypothetical protein
LTPGYGEDASTNTATLAALDDAVSSIEEMAAAKKAKKQAKKAARDSARGMGDQRDDSTL